jgi:protein-L-isoaspartate(D-aspartate) O-methyltransferase
MVEAIRRGGHAESAEVARAMRTVPRHRFVPLAGIEEAYADISVITKTDADGTALSCASTPSIVAMMLDQLDVRPGMRVLEIGAGTGYNAALLAELVGAEGAVTSVDIDVDAVAGARRAIGETGYGCVETVVGDGFEGVPERARFDRVIVTAAPWDLPDAWFDQIVPGGVMVVPLRWRGQTRSVAFRRDADRWTAVSVELCGFVPMVGADGEHTTALDPEGLVSLYWDADQAIDSAVVRGVLDRPRHEQWSTVMVGGQDPLDGIWLHMTAGDPGTCRIAAQARAAQTGLCTPVILTRSPAIAEGESLAYLTIRRVADHPAGRHIELGAVGHGPAAEHLTDRLCQQIRLWDADRTAVPAIVCQPLQEEQSTTAHVGMTVIRKNHVLMRIGYR